MDWESLGPSAAESIQNMPPKPVRSRRRAPSRFPIYRASGSRLVRARSSKHKSTAHSWKVTAQIPRRSGIYRMVCKADGKFYVGSAVNLLLRHTQHWRDLRGKAL
jgi:hypothetical protein